MSEPLIDFLKEAKRIGKTRAEAVEALGRAGWANTDIQKACNAYSDDEFPVLVPRPKIHASPRLTALNLTYFIALKIILICAVSILFTVLDYNLPDGLGRMQGMYYNSAHSVADEMRGYLSTLIASLPFIILSARWINRSARQQQYTPRIRLWLVYGCICIGACILLINFALFIGYFLEGQLSLRFILKTVLLIGLVVSVYAYFRPELNANERHA